MRRAAACALLACVALAGCGGQLAPASSEDEARARIGFVPKSLNQEFWVNTKKGAEAAARETGAEVLTQAGGSDLEIVEQIDIVENLLTQEIDALVIAPTSSDLLKPVLERAAREIPVVLFDSDIPDWRPKTAYVGTENEEGGRKAGEYIARELGEGGTLAIIAGIPGSQVSVERVDGVKAGLEASGIGVEIVKEIPGNFDREQSVGAMEDILQTNPDVDAVFCANDQMALGAIESIGARGLTDDIMLVGFDGALEATQKILAGEMNATIAQDPYGMGRIGVRTALRELAGEPVRRRVDTGARLVTPRNARDYFEEVRGKLGGTGRGLG